MTDYDNTNTWTLFANDRRREGKNDPTHTGKANVNGQVFYVNAWVKESSTGKRFFSGNFKPMDAAPAVKQPIKVDMDDEIPFAPEWRG